MLPGGVQLSHRAEQHPLQGGQGVRQVSGSKCHRQSTALSADTSNLLHLLARFKTKHALPLLFWHFRLHARFARRFGQRIPLAPPPFAQIDPLQSTPNSQAAISRRPVSANGNSNVPASSR